MKSLKSVFPDDRLHIRIARLLVLYEDLRIETSGLQASTLKGLDFIDKGNYRRRYFLRRSIGTINEFSEALTSVNRLKGFQQIKAKFGNSAQEHWDEMIRFFKVNKHLFRNVRNDLGGHFGEEAAAYSVSSFREGTTGSLEIYRSSDTQRVTYKVNFVGEITARAFLRHLKGKTFDDKVHNLVIKTKEAHRLAARSVIDLLRFYVWERFR